MDSLSVEVQDDIMIYTFHNSSEQAVDTWVAELICHLEMTPPELPFRVLMDVSSPQVNFTLYARQQSLMIFSQFKQRQGRIAFLFSSKTAPYFAHIFFATIGKLTFERGYFSDQTKAMTWLCEI
jgi:hypothetical protein